MKGTAQAMLDVARLMKPSKGIEEMLETSSVTQCGHVEIFLAISWYDGARGNGICIYASMTAFAASSRRVSIPIAEIYQSV